MTLPSLSTKSRYAICNAWYTNWFLIDLIDTLSPLHHLSLFFSIYFSVNINSESGYTVDTIIVLKIEKLDDYKEKKYDIVDKDSEYVE